MEPPEATASWAAFDGGVTLGERGSEGGIIVLDEEHPGGARITLERDCSNGVPVAITCGVYGWFFHTRFVGSADEADWAVMRSDLGAILDLASRVGDPEDTIGAIRDFVARFP